jgi:hypothetical protein
MVATGPLESRGRTCIIIAALAHIISCVLMTAFGMPVEPEVNSSLPTVSGVIFAIDSSTAFVAGVAARSAKDTLLMPSQGRVTCTTVTPVRSSAFSAFSKVGPSCTITTAGLIRLNRYLSLA